MMPVLVGITGGIGAGKSICSKIFQTLQVPVYYADPRAKKLMHEEPLKSSIEKLFGSDSFKDGNLDNIHIGKIAFANPDRLKKLNSIVHPAVKQDFEQWAKNQTSCYVMKEAALLFETGSYKELDKIIVVTAPVELRINRVLKRDQHRNKQDILNIIDKQWPEEEKVRLSDYVIYNDEQSSVIRQVMEIHKSVLNLASSHSI
jgi:dephospho-CoA kinase